MGLYTNPSFYNGYTSSDYTSVEPFKGEHFNYHELGIIAATESAANRDAFMRAIALNELASVEQYGTDQVFYESVNISGIFESIKKFFKKIIEKIHKIFHTFIAKLGSWFQSSKDFAKKYEKEIIKKWGLVKSDWEFKGYEFTNLANSKLGTDVLNTKISAIKTFENNARLKALLDQRNESALSTALNDVAGIAHQDAREEAGEKGSSKNAPGGSGLDSGNKNIHSSAESDDDAKATNILTKLSSARDKMDEWKDEVRAAIVNTLSGKDNLTSLDSKEFTEELFKVFRHDEDSKTDIKLSQVGASASEVVGFLKDYDKIKTEVEKEEKAVVSTIDKLINAVNKAQDDIIKNNKAGDKKKEAIVQVTSFYQSCMGFEKEAETQAFSAKLQALKDKCAQCKEVCVKVIGSSKKMTEESVDYSNYGGSNNFNSFIENVKLV